MLNASVRVCVHDYISPIYIDFVREELGEY